MIALLKEDWIKNPQLKHWNSRDVVRTHKCNCEEPELVELWDQDSCVRGRIDTVVCTTCDSVRTFKIIR